MFLTDYFQGRCNAALTKAADFYKRYGILITWDLWHISSVKRRERRDLSWEDQPGHPEPLGSVFEDPFEEYLGELDLNAQMDEHGNLGTLDADDEPELAWYFENFADVPTVFLIDDIDAGSRGIDTTTKTLMYIMMQPDLYGITQRNFIWIPDCPVGAKGYGQTLAHEFGHVLLGPGHQNQGLMSGWADLDEDEQIPATIQRLRASDKLAPASPVPTQAEE